MKINKWLILFLCILFMTLWSCKSVKKGEQNTTIMEVRFKKPLVFHADLNGDGKDEKITMISNYPEGRMSILHIIISDYSGKEIFNYILPSRKYKDHFGEYYIQKIRYVSSLMKDTYRDLILIYAGATPPELYILYCQPRQYTEGHKMIEDEKFDVLDTGILLEEFQG